MKPITVTEDGQGILVGAPAIASGTQIPADKAGSSYGQILKSTALVGGSSGITILLGIVRTKFLAVLLGPSGVGLMGMYNSITEMATNLAGMGVRNSGVRQIAEAAGSGDNLRVARTTKTLRRISLVLGAAGALLLAGLSHPICRLTFQNTNHGLAVAALSITVFFAAVSRGQAALIQGLRRLRDLVKISVLGALWGTLLGIPIIWLGREAGIVPMLVAASAMTALTSWWYARRINVVPVRVTWAESAREVRSLLGLGLALMACGLMNSVVFYLIRLLVSRQVGLEAVGYYTAAYTLSGIYVGFILQAMGTDFYPRLTGVAADNVKCNRLVNEQAEVSLLLAVPGVLFTLTLAPLVIHIFYSGRFDPAAEVLRWQVLGILGRVASWPMGFILLAKGNSKVFFWTEFASSVVHVALLWIGVRLWGVTGAGVAFFGLYIFYCGLMIWVSRRISGFRWSPANLRLAAWLFPSVAVVFLSTKSLPPMWAMGTGLAVSVICGVYCLRSLARKLPRHRLGIFAGFVT